MYVYVYWEMVPCFIHLYNTCLIDTSCKYECLIDTSCKYELYIYRCYKRLSHDVSVSSVYLVNQTTYL